MIKTSLPIRFGVNRFGSIPRTAFGGGARSITTPAVDTTPEKIVNYGGIVSKPNISTPISEQRFLDLVTPAQDTNPKPIVTPSTPYEPKPIEMYIGQNAKGWNDTDEGKFSSLIDRKERREIDDSESVLGEKGIGSLGDVLKHDELYRQYPEMKNMDIYSGSSSDYESYGGNYQPFQDRGEDYFPLTEMINAKGRTPEETKSIILHELQHAIQEKEGFARGGSPTEFSQGSEAKLARDAMSFRREMDRLPKGMDLSAKANAVQQMYREKGMVDWLPSIEAIDLAMDRLGNPDEQLSELVNFYKLDKRVSVPRPHELYESLGGEIEARDVQARQHYNPQERLQKQPYASQGIKAKDAIVRFR